MACGCGKKKDRLAAAKRSVTASAAKPRDPNEPVAFQPARWTGVSQTPKEA